jgi:mRNA-degrading endonuclease RelE of RelBE toxin-antitoxin system
VVALFAIEFAPEALLELQRLRATDQRKLIDAVEKQLAHEPEKITRRRKQLVGISPPWEQVRPVWQLRVGDFRVFYDVDSEAQLVIIRSVRRKGRQTTEGIL